VQAVVERMICFVIDEIAFPEIAASDAHHLGENPFLIPDKLRSIVKSASFAEKGHCEIP